MFPRTNTLSSCIAVAIATAALAVPATSAADQDLRNPDNQAPATASQKQSAGYQDLRNPDTRDTAGTAQGVVQTPAQPETLKVEPGFDWGDAGIGAASVLGLVLITLSGMFAVVRRRSTMSLARKPPAVTG